MIFILLLAHEREIFCVLFYVCAPWRALGDVVKLKRGVIKAKSDNIVRSDEIKRFLKVINIGNQFN